MLTSLFTIILSLLGIGFLVFIHELGHYFMAKREGITVEVFSIGFGKPFFERMHNGVKWQICWFPFGGFVKMAGMDKTGPLEPSQVEGGFFAAKPWSRIKVAFMGPLSNIVFALFAFSFLWFLGGRDKPFSEFTHYIGWIEKDSDLYQEGVRPGDKIDQLNGRNFQGFKDLLQGAAFDDQALTVSGEEIDYVSGRKTPFVFTSSKERSADGLERVTSITQLMGPAQEVNIKEIFTDSPLEGSGASIGDRFVWVDGALVFSQQQLIDLVNAPQVLLTVERDGQILTTRVPRLQIRDLRLTPFEKEELDDWVDSAQLKVRVEEAIFIPYSLSPSGVVQKPFAYVDEKSLVKDLFEAGERIPSETSLLPGDRILAVQGVQVKGGVDILRELQTRKVLSIVKKEKKQTPVSWKVADRGFEKSFDIPEIEKIVNSLGTAQVISEVGALTLLKPMTPVPMTKLPLPEEKDNIRKEQLSKLKKAIAEIKDPKQKAAAQDEFDLYQKRLMLGVTFKDKMVAYNPQPFVLFADAFKEVARTLKALFTRYLSPKYISGPVGMIQVIQQSWTLGIQEVLYWLGLISLNLGILNLLPIPVLDGGHICIALWEMVTKKPLKAKTMERLIIPFVVLLVLFIIYVTYHDIVRVIKSLF